MGRLREGGPFSRLVGWQPVSPVGLSLGSKANEAVGVSVPNGGGACPVEEMVGAPLVYDNAGAGPLPEW